VTKIHLADVIGGSADHACLLEQQPYGCVSCVVVIAQYIVSIVSEGWYRDGTGHIRMYKLKRLRCALDWHSN